MRGEKKKKGNPKKVGVLGKFGQPKPTNQAQDAPSGTFISDENDPDQTLKDSKEKIGTGELKSKVWG
jgi:hypothetical protein